MSTLTTDTQPLDLASLAGEYLRDVLPGLPVEYVAAGEYRDTPTTLPTIRYRQRGEVRQHRLYPDAYAATLDVIGFHHEGEASPLDALANAEGGKRHGLLPLRRLDAGNVIDAKWASSGRSDEHERGTLPDGVEYERRVLRLDALEPAAPQGPVSIDRSALAGLSSSSLFVARPWSPPISRVELIGQRQHDDGTETLTLRATYGEGGKGSGTRSPVEVTASNLQAENVRQVFTRWGRVETVTLDPAGTITVTLRRTPV